MLRNVLNTIKHFSFFIRDIVKIRGLVFELARNDFKSRYLGSYLGLVWAFVQPTVTVIIFWFVFEVGFKSAPVANFPFILWIVAGIIPWFFLNDGISSATTSIIDKSYLVKKVPFRIGILPLIKILSALIVHLFFAALMVVLFAVYGYFPSMHTLQVLYYLLAAVVLVLGLSWITSALVVFLRDIGQIVAILLQFGFWVTPIFWSAQLLPERYRMFVKLNPVYYITEGYRDSLIHNIWFWDHAALTAYFWCVTGSIFVLGALLFKRLKPHFADVL